MSQGDITQQTLIEHSLLRQLVEGLRATLAWQVQGTDCSRKLSTLRFIAQSFQRHLDRLMALEEHDGYMDLVATTSPRLSRRVDALRAEHGQLRDAARRLVYQLEHVSPTNPIALANIGDNLRALLDRVEDHGRREVRLLQEAVGRDSGGEG
jgi:hemerythrin-like domain-containing protein